MIQVLFTTNKPLAANGTITGKRPNRSGNVSNDGIYQTADAQTFVGSVFSDVAGTLVINQYITTNAENSAGTMPVADIVDTISVPANTPTKINIPTLGTGMNFTFTNGAVAQTVFRLGVAKKS